MEEEKYIYKFADGEISEIDLNDIPPEVLDFLKKDDQRLHAQNKKECYRHIHWEQMENGYESVSLPDRSETAPEKFHREMLVRLEFEVSTLLPSQKELLYKVYCENIPQREICRIDGVSESAVSRRLKRIYKKISKNFAEDR